ncbi:MAG: hypothetical protein EBZ58_01430 [Bacteroidetes bacterium]|nr:hypothetical protein [Bacteroidota bacterium]
MKKYFSLIFILALNSIIAFSQNKPIKVGSDKDKHGCIGAAGYVYSAIKNDCIRVFEQNIQLREVDSKGKSKSIAAIIFSDDKSKAEVFLEGYTAGQILIKKSSNSVQSWSNNELLLLAKNGFQLYKGKTLLFSLK